MNDAPLQFGFGPIRHTRLRPVRHAFGYAGVFLRMRMDGGAARAAAAGLGRWFGFDSVAPVSFRSGDHGDGSGIPLDTWARQMCRQAGVLADGAIWLHTFPRVLGYAFKPVSFWFCHRADGALVAVIAEVNNTFGERHCYLLCEADGGPLTQGRELQAAKVFHVSPFCSVEGRYSFRFFNRPDRALARIDLHDDEGPLLLTSLSGELVPADRATVRRALFGQPLFTIGVIARIHWQALRLWLARVPFHSKPEPPEAFVTRGHR
ncbi:MAG: DUF1365 domain-containing protein [Burkholderiales bacterium]|jgi:DUF1365 family protein